jgi:hypothetical protein
MKIVDRNGVLTDGFEDLLRRDALTEQGANGGSGFVDGIPGVAPELARRFGPYLDTRVGAIGRVVSSEKEPSGAHQFCFWADDGETNLDVGHIVVTFSEEAAVIGVVDEPRRFSDLRSFLDDYFDRQIQESLHVAAPTRRPELLVYTVNVLATRHLRDDVSSQRPPIGGPVFYATPKAIEDSLGREEFSGAAVPALMHINGNPTYDPKTGEPVTDDDGNIVFQRSPVALDEHYLVGPEAGHANWTGQSGLATKTSHALFLTSAVFQTLRQTPERTSVAALMFNVKGPDLLWLDKPATPDPTDDEMAAAYREAGVRGLSDLDHEAYRSLGLVPEPFDKLRIFAPFKPGRIPQTNYGANGSSGVSLDGVQTRGALNTLRDAPGQTEGRVFPILWPLKKVLAAPHKVFEFGDLDDKLWGLIFDIRERGIETMAGLSAMFAQAEAYFEETGATEWEGHHKFTLRKARNRFKGLPGKFGGLLADGAVSYGAFPEADDAFTNQELRVIDIAGCNSNVQELIVSSVINTIWRMAEEEKLGVNKLIIFVDELNKYAPGGGEGGLRDTLVDIAARGRHLNVVLFGAQQFRSKVDDEILGNCGTSLYGRIGDEEMVNSAYRSLSETAKAELLGLRKGRLLVRHAHFRAPLFGTFPFPPTIPGMRGQRVFNQTGTLRGSGRGDTGNGQLVSHSEPADGIWNLLKGPMGDRAPSKADVRAYAHRLTAGQVETVVTDLQRKLAESGANRTFRPWDWCQGQIRKMEQRTPAPF